MAEAEGFEPSEPFRARRFSKAVVSATHPRFQHQLYSGGKGGIRTHGPLAGSLVFKTRALSHSATFPSIVEEAGGFEPPEPVLAVLSISSRAPSANSATLPILSFNQLRDGGFRTPGWDLSTANGQFQTLLPQSCSGSPFVRRFRHRQRFMLRAPPDVIRTLPQAHHVISSISFLLRENFSHMSQEIGLIDVKSPACTVHRAVKIANFGTVCRNPNCCFLDLRHRAYLPKLKSFLMRVTVTQKQKARRFLGRPFAKLV